MKFPEPKIILAHKKDGFRFKRMEGKTLNGYILDASAS
jgi:hypothetical protein